MGAADTGGMRTPAQPCRPILSTPFERIAAMAREIQWPDDAGLGFDPVLAVRMARHGDRGGTVGTRVGALYGGLSLAHEGGGALVMVPDAIHF
jgi:hypothetical protein